MGINGLFAWLRANHGSVITEVRQRFADPRLRGKRVAIDGTLLTMAMHFGGRMKWGDDMAPKAALLGWYHLLGEMKHHSVQPYVIWDRKGVREWKGPEAERRLYQRSLALFRKDHEQKREERLDQFKAICEKWSVQPEEDKVLIRQTAQALRPLIDNALTLDDKGKSVLDIESMVKQATEAGLEDQVAALQIIEEETKPAKPGRPVSREKIPPAVRANEFIKELAQHVKTYSTSIRKRTDQARKAKDAQVVREAIEEAREIEGLSESLDSEHVARDTQERIAEQEVIDERLKAAVLDETYNETPTQTKLTEKEGELLRGFFERDILGSSNQDTPAIAALEKDREARRDVLQAIRYTEAPGTKSIYVNSLDAPSADLHSQCRKLIRLMGVPVLYAKPPFEAEGLGSAMVKAGLADYVVTEDSDVLAYEAPMIRGASSRSALNIIDGRDVRECTGLSSETYLDFCVLLGTDASRRVPGVGPKSILKHMDKYASIEELLENEPKVKAKIVNMDIFMDMVKNARNVFQQLPPTPRKDQLKPRQTEGSVEDWLLQHHQIDFRDPGSMGGTLESGTAPTGGAYMGGEFRPRDRVRIDDLDPPPLMDWPANMAWGAENSDGHR